MAEKKYNPADHSDDLAVLLRANNKLLAEQIAQLVILNQQVEVVALSMVALAVPVTERQRTELTKVLEVVSENWKQEAQDLGKRLKSLAANA